MIEFQKSVGLIEPHECPKCKEISCKDVGTEYGSLGEGGSYDKHQCEACGNIAWIELPD